MKGWKCERGVRGDAKRAYQSLLPQDGAQIHLGVGEDGPKYVVQLWTNRRIAVLSFAVSHIALQQTVAISRAVVSRHPTLGDLADPNGSLIGCDQYLSINCNEMPELNARSNAGTARPSADHPQRGGDAE
ncbi:MAG: hypothetical protein M1813_009125 [Trichoglossum hirsutum]|nr:MAG: hypothetical protein M1813_009125 [Trichoglossum hirsutum]